METIISKKFPNQIVSKGYILFTLFLIACGGGEPKRDRSFDLNELNDSSRGFEALQDDSRKILDSIPKPSPKPKESIELVPNQNEDVSIDDLLTPKPQEESLLITPGSEEANTYKQKVLQKLKHTASAATPIFIGLSKIVSIQGSPDKGMYIAERYRVWNIKSKKASILLDLDSYKSHFKKNMPAITTMYLAPKDTLWVGFKDGTVLTNSSGDWTQLQGGPTHQSQEVTAIGVSGKTTYIGSTGFYEWNGRKFLKAPPLKNLAIKKIIHTSEDKLLILSHKGLFSYGIEDHTLKTVYQGNPKDWPFHSVAEYKGNILLGGKSGLIMIGNNGAELARAGTSIHVLNAQPTTQGSALLIHNDGALSMLSGTRVSTLPKNIFPKVATVHMNNNSIYLGTWSGAVLKTSRAILKSWITKHEAKRKLAATQNFPDACAAAKTLLKDTRHSGNIQTAEIRGQSYVFIEGQQVCPFGKGYIRLDGTALTNSGDSLTLSFQKRIKNIPSRDLFSNGNKVTTAYIRRDGSLLLGTQQGLFSEADGRWNLEDAESEVGKDFISSIVEDIQGNLWVSTRISEVDYEKEIPKSYKALHILIGDKWQHFGAQSGIKALGISGIKIDSAHKWFSTSRGISRTLPSGEIQYLGKRENISHPIIEYLSQDTTGRLWFGHGFFQVGLSWIDGSHYYYTSKDRGLFSDSITRVGQDERGRIWVMDTKGAIAVYDYRTLVKMAEKKKIAFSRALKLPFLK